MIPILNALRQCIRSYLPYRHAIYAVPKSRAKKKLYKKTYYSDLRMEGGENDPHTSSPPVSYLNFMIP